MKPAIWFVLILTVGRVSVLGAQTPVATVRPSTDGITCSSFKWLSDKNSAKAGMVVPISIAGKHYWYQLDTGADVVSAYGAGEHENWIPKADFTLVRQVRFAGLTLAAIPLFRQKNIPDKDIQGTVGLDLLVGYSFIIDFPKERVCLLRRADMPDSLSQSAAWVPAEIRSGKLFIDDVTLNGKKVDVIFDTGTSPDELAVDFDLWKQATGKKNADDATIKEQSQTWGQMVEHIGAKATGSLLIGKQAYPNPTLTTSPSRPNSYQDDVYGASGALGNALFFNSIVILDLGSHPLFGIVSPSNKKK